MQNQIREKIKGQERTMDSEDLQPRTDQFGKSTPIRYIPVDEKIPVEIRDIVRIKPEDFKPFKRSFEEFIAQWD